MTIAKALRRRTNLPGDVRLQRLRWWIARRLDRRADTCWASLADLTLLPARELATEIRHRGMPWRWRNEGCYESARKAGCGACYCAKVRTATAEQALTAAGAAPATISVPAGGDGLHHHPLCMAQPPGDCACPAVSTCRACPDSCKDCTWDNGDCECYHHDTPVVPDA